MAKKTFTVFVVLIFAIALVGLSACTDDGEIGEMADSKVVFTIGQREFSASLVDNEATKTLIDRLRSAL